MKRMNRSWKFKLLLLGLSLVVSFGIAELGLRVVGVTSPMLHQTDAVTGRSLRPGARGWSTSEGRAYVQINSDGMRDREFSVEKSDGCLRIAVLGDSFAEAVQVSLEDSFPKVMERVLNENASESSPPIEVLNFGVEGYGTGSQWLTLRHKVWKYDPDVVLLAMFTGNDIRNNSRALSQQYDLGRPFFGVDEAGEIEIDEAFRDWSTWQNRRRLEQGGIASLVHHSAVLQLIRRARQGFNRPGNSSKHVWDEPGVDLEVFREPESCDWREAWQTTERLINAIHREVKQHRAKLLVVTLSNGIQVHPDGEVRQAFKDTLGIEDVFYPDRRIAQHCQSEGIPVLSLAARLRRLAQENDTFFHGFDNTQMGTGHWNEKGHQAAGQMMAAASRQWIEQDERRPQTAQRPKKSRR